MAAGAAGSVCRGAGQTVRSRQHAALLAQAVLAALTTEAACRRKANRPPGSAALAELAKPRGLDPARAEVISRERNSALAQVTR